jgi:hypothetical protein
MNKHDNENGSWAALIPGVFTQGGLVLFALLFVPFMAVGLLFHETAVQAHALSAAGYWPFTWIFSGGIVNAPDPVGLGFGVLSMIFMPVMILIGTWIFALGYWLWGAGILLAQFPLALTSYPNLNGVGLPLLFGLVQMILMLRYASRSVVLPLGLGIAAGALAAIVCWVLPILMVLFTWPYVFVVWLLSGSG